MTRLNMLVPLEVGLGVRDLPRMRRFYEDVLGLAFVNEVSVPGSRARQAGLSEGGYTVVRLQTPYGERIKLFAAQNPPSAQVQPRYILEKANASYLTFVVSGAQTVVARMQAAGIEFISGEQMVEVRPGTWVAFCRDPEGNVLEIVEYDDIAGYRADLALGQRQL